MSKKVLYIFDASDWGSRMEVANYARDKGIEVVIGLINGEKTAEGFKIIPLKKHSKLSPLNMMHDINSLIKQENPDIIHTVTLKYGFITGIAAFKHKKTRKIYTLAGLGYLFRGNNIKSTILRSLLKPLLTIILRRKNTILIFQNQDDLDLMVQSKYVRRKNSYLIKGSGVYLDKFTTKASSHEDEPLVLMPTRLVHEKGVAIFIEAARILKSRGVNAKFQIAGGETKHNPRAISAKEMKEMIKCGAVEWLGRVSDMPELLSRATLIVYPSYYGEGIPRVLLESCAAGRAIITTDHAGCREAVEHGINGLLVTVRNAEQTANAILELISNHERRIGMEKASRVLAEKEFDIHIIANKTANMWI